MPLAQLMRDHGREHALELDMRDELKDLRNEFIVPTQGDLRSKTLARSSSNSGNDDASCIYFCGNSLGLQPRRAAKRIDEHLTSWARKEVFGHFKAHEDSQLPPYLHVDDAAAKLMAPLVGALPREIAVMQTLTANLHLMMASFYRPTQEKYKVIIEGKAFPSDQYAVESQIRFHGFNPKDAMVLVEPDDLDSSTISTLHILNTIEKHAPSIALILLPGVQFYTGQYLDILQITSYAHSLGLSIGWDLAHAVGNVDLLLHDWDVDFAVWCNYKYVNSGPGAIGGLFVHEKHGEVNVDALKQGKEGYRPRLSGWWGGDKATRFKMENEFVPIPGAAGYQLSNPSALDLAAVIASLEVFALTDMATIRKKSVALTAYLEDLLLYPPLDKGDEAMQLLYKVITPTKPAERGAQLSIRLKPGLLDGVLETLEAAGVVVDERQPDVIRVAPAPLYNTYSEVWDFVEIFAAACLEVSSGQKKGEHETVVLNGHEDKGCAQIK